MSGRYSARQAKVSTGPDLDPNPWTSPVTQGAILLTTIFANGNFNDSIIPGSETSNLQQYVVIVMWITVAIVSYFRRTVLRINPAAGFFMGLAPYAIAIVSVFWSDVPAASIPKAIAMGLVIFAAFRLVKTMALDEIVESVIRGLFFLNTVSIFLALFVPGIGLVKDYQHAGQWNGLFASKQTLGVCGALLMFFSAYRLIGPSPRLYHWAAAAAALACVLGSGSRGGGALAAAAVACLYIASVSPRFSRVLAYSPFLMCLIGIALIIYFVQTGARSIIVFDADVDFTQRTFIWQHALGYFKSAPILGYGLNGFWTQKDVKDLFIERNGWFLDNYHDGYIAIIVETGVLGLGAFTVGYFLYARQIIAEIRRNGVLDRSVALTLVYTCLIFFIDFTETYFLRSTNIASTLLTISLFVVFARVPGLAAADPDRNPVSAQELPRGARVRRTRLQRFRAP